MRRVILFLLLLANVLPCIGQGKLYVISDESDYVDEVTSISQGASDVQAGISFYDYATGEWDITSSSVEIKWDIYLGYNDDPGNGCGGPCGQFEWYCERFADSGEYDFFDILGPFEYTENLTEGCLIIEYQAVFVPDMPAPFGAHCEDEPLFEMYNGNTYNSDVTKLKWEYLSNTGWADLPNFSNLFPLNKSVVEIFGENYESFFSGAFTLRHNALNGTYIKNYPIDIIGCSVGLIDDPIQTIDATCNGESNGGITLTFEDDISDDFEMRYFIFQGTPPPATDDQLRADPPVFPNQSFADPLGITMVELPDGTGNHSGTFDSSVAQGGVALDGSSTIDNGATFRDFAEYYIIYQEVRYNFPNPDDVIVKSFGRTESFIIEQPSQIIATGSIEAPQFCGDTAKITFGASGGNNLNSTGNYSYQYRINSTNDADWSNISANPQPVDLVNVEQTVQIRAQYSVNSCFSDATTLTDNIEAAAPDLTLSDPQTGVASSITAPDGVIRASYGGGAPNYIFSLSKWNEATLLFDDVSNPMFNNNTTNSTIEFSSLLVGTYRITILDANGCSETTEDLGDIEVSTAAIPQLEVPIPNAPFCNNGTDGEVSIELIGTVNPYTYRVTNVTTNSTSTDNGTQPQFDITDLSPGNYTIEIIFTGTGDFLIPATVAVDTFTISDPDPITISLLNMQGLDCNGTSDGYIEIEVSETGDFEYSYRNLGVWIELDANGRIPITQAGTYFEIVVRKTPNVGDTTFCTSNVLEDVIVPAGIAVSEVIASHQDVSTNGGNEGAIVIDVTGGTPGVAPDEYTFAWSGILDIDGSAYSNTNQNINNLFAGTYQVIVTDTKTCMATLMQAITISEPGPLSIQSFTGTDTCNGIDTGTLTATVQGTGDIIFEFILEPGPGETVLSPITTSDRTVVVSNMSAGTYGLRITEVVSNSNVSAQIAEYVTISELTPITATIEFTPTCPNTNSGTITITNAVGGSFDPISNYRYSIDGGVNFQNTGTFNTVAEGDHEVVIEEDGGCSYNETVVIIETLAISWDAANSAINNISAPGLMDGSISPVFVGGFDDGIGEMFTYSWLGPNVGGITNQNISGLIEGLYTVTVTDDNGCELNQEFTIGEQSAFSITDFTGTPTCFGQSIGSLTATIAATGTVTFNWRLEDGTLIAGENSDLRTLSTQGLGAGTYYLEIVNADASQTAQSGLFEIVTLPEVSATIEPIATCIGASTGSITFSNPIGSPSDSYSYSIDDGMNFQASPLFENLATASYTLRVRTGETNLCDFVVPGVTIVNAPAIFWDEVNTQITRASGAGLSDGAIAPAFTGGTAPLTYLWSANANNATSQNITAIAAGTYEVIVTDASGCSISQSFEVTEVGPLTITNITPINATCKDEANGSITTTATGEGVITFLWTRANGDPVPVSNGINTANLTGILAGDYILTATDDNTTVITATITITEPATLVSITNIDATDVSCFGGNDGRLDIQATGGSGTYTYSINGGTFQASPITNLISNSYNITVRDANGCEFTEPTPVLITAPLELNLIINEQRPVTAANATNGAIFITAEGGSGDYTYQWTGPNGFTSADEDISNLAAGNYNVTITDGNFAINNDTGCRLISADITITEPGVLIANLTQTVLLECSGDDFGEITANVQGGITPYTYEWFEVTNGNNTVLNEDSDIIADLSVGTYFLRATDANSTSIDSDPIIITAPTQLQITIDNTTNVICVGQPTGSANITVTGGTPPYQYFWSNAATVADVSGLDAGEYSVEVEDANGCIIQSSVIITAPDDAVQIADITLNNASAYQELDGSISLDIIGGSAPYTYEWTRLSDNASIGNQATISNLAADSYTVFISDANGCNITETYDVKQPDILEDTIVQPSCTGETDGSITILANQGNGSFTYTWSTGETENNINNLGAGSYTVTVTGFETGPITRTYVLENPVPLEVDLGLDRVLCVDQVLELDATVADDTASYAWTSDNGFSSTASTVIISQTGNYTVTVQSQTGCTTEGTIFVEVSTDEIDSEFAMSSQAFVGETIVAVDISFPLPDGIEWILPINAKIATQDKDAVEFSFAEAGEYEITVVTSRGDCIAQKTKNIIIVAKDGLIDEQDSQTNQKLVEDFIVYPNPTNGKFTADINLTERGDVSIKVFSFANNGMVASKKERGETSYSIPFDISGMPSGVYAVLLETPYGTSLRKIIIR